jgi:hypothetical protein
MVKKHLPKSKPAPAKSVLRLPDLDRNSGWQVAFRVEWSGYWTPG